MPTVKESLACRTDLEDSQDLWKCPICSSETRLLILRTWYWVPVLRCLQVRHWQVALAFGVFAFMKLCRFGWFLQGMSPRHMCLADYHEVHMPQCDLEPAVSEPRGRSGKGTSLPQPEWQCVNRKFGKSCGFHLLSSGGYRCGEKNQWWLCHFWACKKE